MVSSSSDRAVGQLLQKSNKIEPALISTLQENPWQPRLHIDPDELENLKKSIRDFGFIGYVPVRRADESDPYSPLQIIYGHRRVKAAELVGHSTVPVMICRLDDEGMMRLGYVENSTQKRMTYWEEALHFHEMKTSLNLTVRSLADMLGVSRGYVFNRMGLLSLPEDSPLRAAAQHNDISMSNAIVFMNLAKALEPTQLEALIADVRESRITHEDIAALQKALDASIPKDAEVSEEGSRVITATLVDQARQKLLRSPKTTVVARDADEPLPGDDILRRIAEMERRRGEPMSRDEQIAVRAEETRRRFAEIADDLPPGPTPEAAGAITLKRIMQTVELPEATAPEGPIRLIRVEHSSFAQRQPRDYALRAIEQVRDFVPHLRANIERADFAALTEEERIQYAEAAQELCDLLQSC